MSIFLKLAHAGYVIKTVKTTLVWTIGNTGTCSVTRGKKNMQSVMWRIMMQPGAMVVLAVLLLVQL